ncbi:aldo/keto reductase [Rhizobium sp. CF142]|uniref:aldo/keto reductase n=1 Tax=Rhizobium sp. CF142 TaxID=1144314 RepID=UPI00026EE938|nr:aldo/keto reductase [Rhizobium sp. CF142]EJJ31462.1 putative oxidoreductase, aryl-alcohol dehydrogenase like protein [Rhizobium sp. CF142]
MARNDKQRIVLGSSHLGLDGGTEHAFRLLDAFVALGGTIIDTAAVYSDWIPGEKGRSERIIGDWLQSRPRPPELQIATKGGHPFLDSMSTSRLDANSILSDIEGSLRRLRVDEIDLYYLHRDDEGRPVEEILKPLADARSQGKIVEVGLSNWRPARILAAIESDLIPIASNQLFGNALSFVAGPLADASIIRLDGAAYQQARRHSLSMMLFSSQCQGFFNRWKTRPDEVPSHYGNPECLRVAKDIADVADGLDADPTTIALAFLLNFSPLLFPVVGPKSSEQLEATLQASAVHLDDQTLTALRSVTGYDKLLTNSVF